MGKLLATTRRRNGRLGGASPSPTSRPVTNAPSASSWPVARPARAGHIVAPTPETLTLVNPRFWPNNPGSLIVVPIEHNENLYVLTDEVGAAVHRAVREARCALRLAYACRGTSTRQHNEPAGYQDVWHYHVHVFPRQRGDRLYSSHPAVPRSRDNGWVRRKGPGSLRGPMSRTPVCRGARRDLVRRRHPAGRGLSVADLAEVLLEVPVSTVQPSLPLLPAEELSTGKAGSNAVGFRSGAERQVGHGLGGPLAAAARAFIRSSLISASSARPRWWPDWSDPSTQSRRTRASSPGHAFDLVACTPVRPARRERLQLRANGAGWRETGDDLPGMPPGDIDRRWLEAVAEGVRLGRTPGTRRGRLD